MNDLFKKYYIFVAIFAAFAVVFMWNHSVEFVSRWPLFSAGVLFGAFIHTRPHKEFLKLCSRFATILSAIVSAVAVFSDSGSNDGWFVLIPFLGIFILLFITVSVGILLSFLVKELYINIRQLFS